MRRFTGWVVAALTLVVLGTTAGAAERSGLKEIATFNTIQAPSEVKVRLEAARWLKDAGKYDSQRQAFDALWNSADVSLLDRVAGTFVLGDSEVAKLLSDAKNPLALAPTSLPALLSDTSKSSFFRANLALAYAKALINRKVYEEGLETLRLFKVDQVVDPASYLFFKAVAEHGQMLKKDANETIAKLLDDVPAAPERYKMVAALMHFDMVSWQDSNVLDKLANIGRKMDNIQRRLDLARGGQKTQKQQKDVVARLDEIIKELENQANSGSTWSNGGNCPSGGQAQKPGSGSNPSDNIQASSPQQDSVGGNGSGPGEVDMKRVKDLAEQWGRLPARDREAGMRDLTKEMDPRYREIIVEYFRRLSLQDSK